MPCAFDHDHVLYHGRAFGSLIGDVLQADDFAPHPPSIGRYEDPTLGVLNALGQGLHAEAAVDHRVDGADFRTGQHGDGQFGDATHVDGHPVPLLHPHALEDVGETVHLLPKAVVGEGAAVPGFALPDQGQLVTPPRLHMAVQGVVNDVRLRADKPLVKGRITVVQDLLPGFEPVHHLLSPVLPEFDRVFGALLPVAFVILGADVCRLHDMGWWGVHLMLGLADFLLTAFV